MLIKRTGLALLEPDISVEESIEWMKKETGSHFDPQVFDAFLRGMDEIKSVRQTFDSLDDRSQGHLEQPGGECVYLPHAP